MGSDHCSCGETLVTRDEVKRSRCWMCAGLTWRLSMLDAELAALAAAAVASSRAGATAIVIHAA